MLIRRHISIKYFVAENVHLWNIYYSNDYLIIFLMHVLGLGIFKMDIIFLHM